VISQESFLEGVQAATPQRRVLILFLCGFIAGFGWWALYRYGRPLISIAESVKSIRRMPAVTTMVHALLQIVTIALGSPLGREVAPREVGTVWAGWVAQKTGLSSEQTRTMLACGAGAGLAAVYNVPLGGALFTLEVLLGTMSWPALIPALMTSAIAVVVSWMGLGNASLYQTPALTLNTTLVIWSIVTGPVFGYAAYWFIWVAGKARNGSWHDWRMPLICIINFTMIGFLAIDFPSLLGNGKSPAQLAFANSVGIGLALVLLVLRTLMCWSSLKAGAQGGLLTPSLANGALLAVILGGVWSLFWPGASMDAFAIIGAVAFLAAAQKMPLTAIVLLFEFTRINLVFFIPAMLAVAGSVSMHRFLQNQNANH
jgi:H+/Cl- antiporter ClcA